MNCPRCDTEISEHEDNDCLDRWVAEAVMGWHLKDEHSWSWLDENDEYQYSREYDYDGELGFDPSTDILAAWEIVDKLTDETQRFELITGHQDIAWIVGEKSGPKLGLHICCVGDTMPHAICRAALKLVSNEL